MVQKSARSHILIFEAGIEGHHLSWLRYITEDLLAAGFTVTLAIDGRREAQKLLQENLALVLPAVSLVSVFNEAGRFEGGGKLAALAHCLNRSGADEVLVTNLDYLASQCLRKAALGIFPPVVLRGRISGIYFRPRFLAAARWPPGNALKAAGFRRLCQNDWFRHIYFMDESLRASAVRHYPGPEYHVLPDPWDGKFTLSPQEARAALGIPGDRTVLLHYGIGGRRKGLHLTIGAMLELPHTVPAFLLCAGNIAPNRTLRKQLAILERSGRARVLDRYVSDAEQDQCFCASDIVVLPYRNHFGSSGVLSLAAAAGRMVIASDENLVGRLVRAHKLGMLFPSGSLKELKRRVIDAVTLPAEERRRFAAAAHDYAASCSRAAFRQALLSPFIRLPQGTL